MFMTRLQISLDISACEQAAVHPRVQCLDPATHHLRKSGHFLDRAHGDSPILEHCSSASCGQDLDSQLLKGGAQLDHPLFVADSDQGALNLAWRWSGSGEV